MIRYHVWIWKDPAAGPVFVGWGREHLIHPALRIFRHAGEFNSELTDWLQEFVMEPEREDVASAAKLTKREARALAEATRERLRARGIPLLNQKPRDRLGGGGPRMVVGPDLEIYTSVRAASISEEVSPSTITRRCATEGNGWDYLS
jgi:hypothetical protein